jgi:hypothetical protein
MKAKDYPRLHHLVLAQRSCSTSLDSSARALDCTVEFGPVKFYHAAVHRRWDVSFLASLLGIGDGHGAEQTVEVAFRVNDRSNSGEELHSRCHGYLPGPGLAWMRDVE